MNSSWLVYWLRSEVRHSHSCIGFLRGFKYDAYVRVWKCVPGFTGGKILQELMMIISKEVCISRTFNLRCWCECPHQQSHGEEMQAESWWTDKRLAATAEYVSLSQISESSSHRSRGNAKAGFENVAMLTAVITHKNRLAPGVTQITINTAEFTGRDYNMVCLVKIQEETFRQLKTCEVEKRFNLKDFGFK